MVVSWNILWTGKAMGQRNGHGFPEKTSSISCWKPFTPLIQIVLGPEGEVDHHDVGVLGPQEWAVEEGVLSRIGQAHSPPNHSAQPHLSTDCTHLFRICTHLRKHTPHLTPVSGLVHTKWTLYAIYTIH